MTSRRKATLIMGTINAPFGIVGIALFFANGGSVAVDLLSGMVVVAILTLVTALEVEIWLQVTRWINSRERR